MFHMDAILQIFSAIGTIFYLKNNEFFGGEESLETLVGGRERCVQL